MDAKDEQTLQKPDKNCKKWRSFKNCATGVFIEEISISCSKNFEYCQNGSFSDKYGTAPTIPEKT